MIVAIDVRTSPDGTRIVRIAGTIDSNTAEQVHAVLLELFEKRHFSLLVNLEQVRRVDSTGLGMLVRALQRVRANGGRLDLVCADPLTRKLFEVTGVARAFTVFRDEPAAARALARAG